MNPEGIEPAEPTGEVEQQVEAPEAPWTPPQDQWDAIVGYVQQQQQREQQMAQLYAPQGDGQQQQGPDFYEDPEGFVRNIVQQSVAPFQQFTQDVQMEEAEERAMDILGDLAARDGDFNREHARALAERLLPQYQQRYQGAEAAEKALEAAAAQQRAFEDKLRQDAVSQHTNHIQTLSGAPGEPGSTYAVGVQQRTLPDYRTGGSVTNNLFRK